MKPAEDILQKAKARLIMTQPFFACLALGMDYRPDPSVPNARTDGFTVRYNPEVLNTLPMEQVETLLAKCCMKRALLHHCRRAGRDLSQWNKAGDEVINPILHDAGFELPAGETVNDAYREMSAEQVYQLLPEPPKQDGGGEGEDDGENGDGSGDGGAGQQPSFGEVEDAPAQSAQEMREIADQTKQDVAQAAMAGKRAGNLPGQLKRMVDELLNPQLPWEEILNRFLTEVSRNDYNWRKPSVRYQALGLYLPSLESVEIGRVALIVDTSISIDRELLNRFGAEVQQAAALLKFPAVVVYVDTKVQGVQELEAGDELKPVGGGGTDFVPGFHYLNLQYDDVRAIIYLTDGECHSFPSEPDVPTLWAVYDNPKFEPPFGEVMNVQ